MFQAVVLPVLQARPVGFRIAAQINVSSETHRMALAQPVPSLQWAPAFFCEVIACRVVRLTAHSHIVPRLRMSGSTTQHSHMPPRCRQR